MSATPCLSCTAPADATLCHPCTDALSEVLSHVPMLVSELDTVLAGEANLRPTRGQSPAEPVQMPYDVAAAECAAELRSVLLPWVHAVRDQLGINVRPGHTSTKAFARGLQNYVGFIRRMAGAEALLLDLQVMVEKVRRVIDARPEQVYVGSCRSTFNGEGERQHPCPGQLYAAKGHSETTCRTCGTGHKVEARRRAAMAAVEHQVLSPQLIANALTRNGEPLNAERIYNWVKRGLLTPAGLHPKSGRKLYRVSDVRAVLAACEASPNNPRKALAEMRDAA